MTDQRFKNQSKMSVHDWAMEAMSALGDSAHAGKLSRWMIANGWRSKSPRPAEVVGATLRAKGWNWDFKAGCWEYSDPYEHPAPLLPVGAEKSE